MGGDEKDGFSIHSDLFEQYLHIAEVMILVLDRNAHISFINRKGEQILGLENSQLIGTSWIDTFIPQRNRDEVKAVFREIVAGKVEPFGFYENPIINRSGKELIIKWHNTVLKDGDGEIIGTLSSGEDITQQKRTERELQKSRDDWENIFQAIGDPTFILDTEYTILHVNRSASEAFGMRPDEMKGRRCYEICHGTKTPPHECPMGKIIQTGEHQREVMEVQTLNGIFLVSCTPIKAKGKTVKVIHVASDITEQKRMETELKESEERFRSLVEDINDIIYSLDPQGRLTYLSPAFGRIFSYDIDELMGKSFVDFIHPDDLPKALERFEQLFEGDLDPYQYRLIDKDGRYVYVESSARRVYRDGKPIGLFGVLRDITEQKKMQEQFLQTEKLSSLGGILSGVAHELNNPLTTIVGFSELLAKKEMPENIKEDLTAIHEEAIRSSKIVQSLLTFARKHAPEKRMVNINEIIQDAYRLREYELRVDDVRTEFELSAAIPSTFADPYQLQQVFINLLNNAHHALLEKSGGKLHIRTFLEKDIIIIEFEDNGPGIPDKHVNKIFDPFFTTKEVGKGTGLGLSVVFGIVKEHGGEVSVESEAGIGTRFTIKLPVLIKTPDHEATHTDVYSRPEGAFSVLVVEDEELLRKFLSTVITAEGYYVRGCGNGGEAIRAIEEENFDLIVSDMKMTGIGGQNLYTYIQKYHPDLVNRMLFITGDVLGRETQEFFKITGCRYLEKPFTASKLLSLIGELLLSSAF